MHPSFTLSLFILAAAALFAAPVPALAGGSVGLDEVVKNLAGQSTELMDEIEDALEENDEKITDIICDGARLGAQWTSLGGARVSPFTCPIGKRTLIIEADVHFYDEEGNEGADPETALYVSMNTPTWSWQ